MHYVIIGNSAAGVFAAEAIRTLDQEGQVDILSDEEYPAYARCLTSSYLTGKIKDSDLWLRPGDFYSKNNLNLHTGLRVTGINPAENQISTNKNLTFNYDKLLIAAGASPAVPNFPGVQAQGVFVLRTLTDAKSILDYAGPGKKIVVIGGGLVALEACYALLQADRQVTCIENADQIFPQTLDKDSAAILTRLLSARGLNIKTGCEVTEIVTHDADSKKMVTGVCLSNGDSFPADVVLIAVGVVPNTGFLAGSGINVDTGIVVDKYLQTNLPGIYAAGDVAQGPDRYTGANKINAVWPNATEQGTVAGLNMAGRSTPYAGSIGMNSFDFYGVSIIAAGQAKAEGEGYEVVTISQGENLYRRFVFKDDTLAGYIMVGDTTKAGVLTSLIQEKTPLGKMKDMLKQGIIKQKALW